MEQKNKIDGIVCHVETCEYHSKDDKCVAGKISVGGCTACNCSDTCCNTFKAKMQAEITRLFSRVIFLQT